MTDLPPHPPPPPAGEPVTPEPEASEEGLLETALSVITEPVATLRRVTRDARLGWAIAVVVAVSVASGLVFGATFEPDPAFGPGLPSGLRGVVSVFAAVVAPVFSLFALVVATAVMHLASLLLKGRGTFQGLFCGLAFSQMPSLVAVPVQLLPLLIGPAGAVLAGLAGFGVAIWVLVLWVIAVRENNAFSTGRAVAAVLMPLAVFIALLTVLFFLLFALFVAGTGMEGFPAP